MNPRNKTWLVAWALGWAGSTAVGCVADEGPRSTGPNETTEDDVTAAWLAANCLKDESPQAKAVLRLANDRTYDANAYQTNVGVRRQVSLNIVDYRQGDDKQSAADDKVFGSMTELDGIPFTDKGFFSMMVSYVVKIGWTRPCPPGASGAGGASADAGADAPAGDAGSHAGASGAGGIGAAGSGGLTGGGDAAVAGHSGSGGAGATGGVAGFGGTGGASSIPPGKTWYIRAGATGANDGSSWANAWNRMASVSMSVLNPGDRIYIAGGTYDPLIIKKSGASMIPITFRRATGVEHGLDTGWNSTYDARVVLDGNDSDAALSSGIGIDSTSIVVDGVTRYGLWLRNAMYGVRTSGHFTIRYAEIGDVGSSQLGEDGVQGDGDNLTVESCYIHDNNILATHGDGIQWFGGNNLIIRYNVFSNNLQTMMLSVPEWGMFVRNMSFYYNVVVNRNLRVNNFSSSTGSPPAGSTWSIWNNTFDLSADDGGYDTIFNLGAGPGGTVDFRNNAILWTCANTQVATVRSHNAYDNSGAFANRCLPSSETNGVFAADLGFVNVTTGTQDPANYHLTASSPLIGKGIHVGLTTDFDGQPVPESPSIGAFEMGPRP